MPEGRLLTVRDIARELGLPESTVRYYRDAFAAYLPVVGTGRRRRYPPEAIPLLRVVAEGYAQNWARLDIERALEELFGREGATAVAALGTGAPLTAAPPHDELLATVLDGERERREVMWQMARELVRLSEAIERQQMLLAQLAERVEGAGRALPPARADDEIESLRRELAEERDLVERLRRSRLEIERRAAEAEAKLREEAQRRRGGGLLGRLLSQETDPGR